VKLPLPDDRLQLRSRIALELSGPDTSTFLQAQLTSDVQSLVSQSVTWSAWLTPKGRVISTLLVARLEPERFLLIVPSSLADVLTKRLKMFVMRSKVEIIEKSAAHYVVLGEAADQWRASSELPAGGLVTTTDGVAMHITANPAQALSADASNSDAVTTDTELPDGAVYCLDYSQTQSDQHQLKTDADDESDWNDWCVRHGLPWIDATTTEAFIPQSLNLDAIGGLSYDKGCYPGQEIVARTHFKGRLKYRTAILNFEENTDLTVGAKVSQAADASRSATVLVTGRQRALMVVPVSWLDNESKSLEISDIDTGTRAQASITAPPYRLPDG